MFDWQLAWQILPILVEAAVTTAWITVVAFLAALVGGLAILIIRRSGPSLLSKAIGGATEFIRSTPLLVQLFFLYFLLPDYGIRLSAVETGLLALSIHYSCYLSEVYRAGLEAIPRSQWDSATALNFSVAVTYRRIILPQVFPQIVPSAGNYLIYMFKDSPLLASISVQELMFTAQIIGTEQFQYLEPLTMSALIFLTLGAISAIFIRIVEMSIGRKWRTVT
jgi:polar amino acid transport system permease protein